MSWKDYLKKSYHNYRRDKRYFNGVGGVAATYVKSHKLQKLSVDEINDIDDYWADYGIRLDDYRWHQMYYDITGIKDPRFMPHNFADAVAYPFYNDRRKAGVWSDKNYFERLLPAIKFPEMLGQKICGKYYDAIHKCYGEEELEDFCHEVFASLIKTDAFVIKKTTDTNTGKGVRLYQVNSMSEFKKVIDEYRDWDSFIIQKAVHQHPFFAQFNSSSVNILRLTTWRRGRDIIVNAPCIRFGIEGSVTDVAYVNGEEIINAIGVRDDGTVMDHSVTLSGEKHIFAGLLRQVPQWTQILEAVKKGHQYLEQFDLVAWDMTVTADNSVICIEYNLNSPGSIVYQMAHGPLFGKYTDDFLAFLKKENNRRIYLPRKIRMK